MRYLNFTRHIKPLILLAAILILSSCPDGFFEVRVIGLDVEQLTFSAAEGGGNPQSQILNVRNANDGNLIWHVSDDAGWLVLDPQSGTCDKSGNEVTVSVDIAELTAGDYDATISVSSNAAVNSPQAVSVSLLIDEPPTITLNPASITFNAVEGGVNPQDQSLVIRNDGGGSFDWMVHGDADWLSLEPANGTSSGEDDTIAVSADITGLEWGNHFATITVTAPEASNSPETMLIILALESQPSIAVNPATLNFSAYENGTNPTEQSFAISNYGGGILEWTVSEDGGDVPWLSLAPTAGSTSEEDDAVVVSIDITGLTIGTHNAAVTITALNASNSPQTVDVSLTVQQTPAGLFKVVNSWGVGVWENVADGFYEFTFEAVKQAHVLATFYDDIADYNPTYLAVFKISHDFRGDCEITVGLGDPLGTPIQTKRFEDYFYRGGDHPFPDNVMVMDISEFAPNINNYNAYLKVLDRMGNDVGTIDSFAVERYNTYVAGGIPTQTVVSTTTLPLSTVDGGSVYAYAPTAGVIGAPPPVMQSQSKIDSLFVTRPLTDSEFMQLKAISGVYDSSRNYNQIINGFGTGLRPPTEEGWQTIRQSVRTIESISAFAPLKDGAAPVDHSLDSAFPPVGNQGVEGSCASFSNVYYIKTYQEARDHGWDLSSVLWSGDWPGAPQSDLDKIMSPDFVYHQVNDGVDTGSTYSDNVKVLSRLGSASWQAFPYSDQDLTTWPDEPAWREAPLYRARIPEDTEFGTYYMFVVDTDEEIEILKALLDANILISISIDAGQYSNFYEGEDIWYVGNYTEPIIENHANTIVGYRELP